MKPQEFIDKWLGWAKNKEEINDEILADLDAMNKALSIPIVSKRLLEVKFRYLNRTDTIIHSDTFEAETSQEALQMLYDKYGYDVEWRTIGDALNVC